MSISNIKRLFISTLAATSLSQPAVAQQAPTGSCLIPNVGWCWPVQPVPYGQVCECPGPDGLPVLGVMR